MTTAYVIAKLIDNRAATTTAAEIAVPDSFDEGALTRLRAFQVHRHFYSYNCKVPLCRLRLYGAI